VRFALDAMLRLFACCLVFFSSGIFARAEQVGVSIDDLVTRGRIVLAAISPDGRYAAWLTARANPRKDAYEMTIELIDVQFGSVSHILAKYDLDGGETFDHLGSLRPAAGGLRWTSSGVLVFTEMSGPKACLVSWNPINNTRRTILDGHDRILLSDSDRSEERIAALALDVVSPTDVGWDGIADKAWRIEDHDRFYGEAINPKIGSFVRTQELAILVDDNAHASVETAGPPKHEWERLVRTTAHTSTHTIRRVVETDGERVFPYSVVPSPKGARSAFVRIRYVDIDKPDGGWTEAGVSITDGANERELVAPTRSHREILGWGKEEGPIYFLETSGTQSVVNAVSIDGRVSEIKRTSAKFEKPCSHLARRCQVLSSDGSVALLLRSTNVTPDELVHIDLHQGTVKTVSEPNKSFATRKLPEVRFYRINNAASKAWGHLYLPTDYRRGVRYPLVVTQYLSDPGFYASVGDEMPILALTAKGFAVFALHLPGGSASATGDIEFEFRRVKRPLEDLAWIIETLANEGFIDRKRVGLSGLSYGAEVAMYAYWRSDLFATLSTASASWDPSLFALGGADYARSLMKRGLGPAGDNDAMNAWRKLAAGLNARANLPPLLIQGAEGERTYTAPTWTALRLARAPIEWFDYPESESGHVKARPANKWWVYTRNVDWFRFWLQGHEESGAAKVEQYKRWRAMRAKQCALFRPAAARWYCHP
jgi:hypothetical protein